ncbi:transcription termination factor Rho [Peptoniphilus equinus]|uniref:Transcription termination factor Rho n=1 Tax=Peptoniphilus equinus TaxID=3016343 RepID=A0ABY7QSC8_9FIRM|nr:transcription termination factor Rho [Peptoniphilus equinus]WBW49231.1 transcription termination factor Rho [Peptoniphilus equinus]
MQSTYKNIEVLKNKSLQDLKNIAVSMGLEPHESLSRGDYYNYITHGIMPTITSFSSYDLTAKSLKELKEIALSLNISSPYKYKKAALIEAILHKQGTFSISDYMESQLKAVDVAMLKSMASELGVTLKTQSTKELIDAIVTYNRWTKETFDKTLERIKKEAVSREDIDTSSLSDNATELVQDLDTLNTTSGILEIYQDGFGFLRRENYQASDGDIYVAPSQIRRFRLRTGDDVVGVVKPNAEGGNALIYIKSVNGMKPSESARRPHFDRLTPIFPNKRLYLEHGDAVAVRMMDLIAPIGKGQRGLIVSSPKSGKTTMLKQIASAITANYPDVHLMVVLVDERPEEVTDMKRYINGEVVYSTFDEEPKNHIKIAESAIERAKRLAESKKDVVLLLDSLTRLTRAYNMLTPPSGKTLSGGLDPTCMYKPKRLFGAARNLEEGGSITILATALIETGSRMDDVIYEEFKGTGNMEVHLSRTLSERRVFPAMDIFKSGTRKEELLFDPSELKFSWSLRQAMQQDNSDSLTERFLETVLAYKSNALMLEKLKEFKWK